MIRIKKSDIVPASLRSRSSYNGQDVQRQLLEDQYEKCYLCERKCGTDYQVEHFKSQRNSLELRESWENLLLACSYCNGKKSASYDNIIYPVADNVEEVIEQRMDSEAKRAVFSAASGCNTACTDETIALLGIIFNGTNKLKKVREEKFYEYFLSQMNRFKIALDEYLKSTTPEKKEDSKRVVERLLKIDQEFLGFKYWLIQDDEVLKQEFASCCLWNR